MSAFQLVHVLIVPGPGAVSSPGWAAVVAVVLPLAAGPLVAGVAQPAHKGWAFGEW